MSAIPFNPGHRILVVAIVVVVAALLVAGALFMFVLPNKATDNTLDQNPGLGAGSIRAFLSKTSISLGESVTDSAIVKGLGNGSSVPTGTVTFQVRVGSGQWTSYDTDMLIANGTDGISNSSAYTPLSIDSYTFRATYSGDNNYPSSQSAEETLNILSGLYAASVSPSLSNSTIGLGGSVTGSVTVHGLGNSFPVPSGSVTFQVRTGSGSWTTYDTKTLSNSDTNGVANSTAYLPLAIGSYSFCVLYSGDSNYLGSQTGDNVAILTVNPGQGTSPVAVVISQTSISFGGTVTASVTVPGIGANFPLPTGSVEFQVKGSVGEWTTYDTKTLSASAPNGVATSAAHSPQIVDSYYFRAVYHGDSNYILSQSGDNDAMLTVNPGNGLVQITSVLSHTTITLGDSVTASVTVNGLSADSPLPTGLVKFQDKIGTGPWTAYDTRMLSASGTNAVATSIYAPTMAGAHFFRAVYLGDAYYMSGESGDSAEPLTVNPVQGAAPTTALSRTTANLGHSVTDSVMVPGLRANFPAPTGTVEFQVKIDSGSWNTYDTKTLSASGLNGVATSAPYLPLNLGSYSFRAIYGGDSNYLSSQSVDGSDLLTVNPGQGVGPMNNVLSQATIGLGNSVTDTVTVPGLSASSPVPTGSITFQVKIGSGSWNTYDTKTLTGSGTNGVATSAPYLPLNLGSYSFRTMYGGDATYLASQTGDDVAPLTVIPGQGAGPITDVLSQTTINLGDSISCTATVPSIGVNFPMPTGSIKFQVRIGSGEWTTYDTKTLSASGFNGVATSNLYKPIGGAYHFRVLYLGDTNYAAGQSGDSATPLTINQIQVNTPVIKVPKTTMLFGQNVSCTATVLRQSTFPVPTGTVDFQYKLSTGQWTTYETKNLVTKGPNGTAYANPFTPLKVGTYSFRVLYLGDLNYTARQSAESVALTVERVLTYSETKLGVDTINLGQSVRDNVTVYGINGSSIIPTGTVSFQVKNGTGPWVIYDANVPLVNRNAISRWYTPMIAAGNFKFQALYSGDENYLASHSCPWSEPLNVLVARPSTSIDIGGAVTGHIGQSYTVNSTITGLGGAYPPITGTVDFQWQLNGVGGWTNITQNVNLVNGVAASTWFSPTDPGRYIFRVVYSGDTNYDNKGAAIALQVYV